MRETHRQEERNHQHLISQTEQKPSKNRVKQRQRLTLPDFIILFLYRMLVVMFQAVSALLGFRLSHAQPRWEAQA